MDRDAHGDGEWVVGDGADPDPPGAVTLRRISPHAYWAACGGYHSTVVVSGSSALLLDPGSGGRGLRIRDAVRSTLDADVTALAYSHAHRDHCADAAELVGGGGVELLATRACAARVGTSRGLAAPTRVLDDHAVLDFHGVEIEARVVGGHTADLTWYRLPAEGVLHLVDLVHPGQAEFEGFGMAPDLGDYRAALRTALDADWTVLTAGHGRAGRRDDVALVLDYLADLETEVAAGLAAHPPEEVAEGHTYARFAARLCAVQADVLAALSPGWGALAGFAEVAPSHVTRMVVHLAYFA